MGNLSTFTQDPTIAAIYAAIERDSAENPRHYLGASIIGKPCARQLWQDFRWVQFEQFSGRMYRLFATGHLEEPRFIANLKAAGVEAYDVDDRTGEQFAVQTLGGHFRGHADGVALGVKGAEKTWHLLEFKTHSEKSFNKLVGLGMQDAKPEHYAQAQVYMHLMGLSRAYYLAKNKNTDELYGERIKYNRDYAQGMIDRAERIIFANEPPQGISDKPTFWQCRFCNYHSYCHKGEQDLPSELPQMNCRTCIHSTPQRDGTWLCEHDDKLISYDEQLKGCADHRYIPMLLPSLEVRGTEDTGIGATSIFYRAASGQEYVNNGNGSVVTKEIYQGKDLCIN